MQPACQAGRFVATAPLFLTIKWAYDLDGLQNQELRAQLPEWTQSVSGSYDLEATTQPGVTEEQCRRMTQKLLEDRFRLKYHWETVTAKVYELVPARGGLKMQPADDNRRLDRNDERQANADWARNTNSQGPHHG